MDNIIREAELKGQLIIISGYISKIDFDNWTLKDIREALSKDYEYLQQEFAVLQVQKITHNG